MATKLALKSHPPPLTLFLRKPSLLTKPLPKLFSTISSSLTLTKDFPYGPSLHKGNKTPSQSPLIKSHKLKPESEECSVINKESFCRVFDIAAIRVPVEDCFALENCLRGHLLNWPRVRNIARVSGDEIDEQFKKLLPDNVVREEGFEALNRRIHGRADGDGDTLSSVLYRDKLVSSFNSRGYVKFRNLAKISRPKKKKDLKVGGEEFEGKKRIGKNDFVVVEVVGEDEDDMSGLLGGEFKRGGNWRGSTRLLLLDERFVNSSVEELPEAVKAILMEDKESRIVTELVKCKLTLFYNYWQMNEILESLLPKGMIVPSAFETVGHIAHLNLRDEHLPFKKLIAQVVLDKNQPKIQTVVNKVDAIQNDYRTMQLDVIAGNCSLVTTVVENGIRFHLDLATVYWSSKLGTERQRLVNGFTSTDVVCDVFSGVGPIAIASAKKVKLVYANDLNPSAVEYLERNSILNKLERKIKVSNMDGRRFIDAVFTSQKAEFITQVVMNLPKDAVEYLDAFRGIFRKRTKGTNTPLPMIHVYGFSKAQDPEFDLHQRIRTELLEFAVEVEMHRVRLVAPGKWMLCASFVLPESVAFARQS